jgi:hypothetical protein
MPAAVARDFAPPVAGLLEIERPDGVEFNAKTRRYKAFQPRMDTNGHGFTNSSALKIPTGFNDSARRRCEVEANPPFGILLSSFPGGEIHYCQPTLVVIIHAA